MPFATNAQPRTKLHADGVLLVTPGSLNALRAGGVANLDAYPVNLKNPAADSERRDFSTVNLVGFVDAIDLATLGYEVRRGKPRFTGAIAIAKKLALSLLAFRLPINPRFMVIAASVAAQIDTAAFTSVLLQPTLAYQGT